MPSQPDPGGPDTFDAWLRLARPIPAKLGGEAVQVVDLGPSRALLSGRCNHAPGTEHELSFAERGIGVRVRCLITGTADHEATSDIDVLVRFLESSDGLSQFIDRYEEQIRLAEEANAAGNVAANIIDGDRMLSDLGSAARAMHAFLRYRFRAGTWSREATQDRAQPGDGFTISASETEDQIQLLQLAYEESAEAERALLREFAAASLSPDR